MNNAKQEKQETTELDERTEFVVGYLIAYQIDSITQYWPVVVGEVERDRVCKSLRELGAATRYCSVEMTVPGVCDLFDLREFEEQPADIRILELTFQRK